jgi:hypothetical protein
MGIKIRIQFFINSAYRNLKKNVAAATLGFTAGIRHVRAFPALSVSASLDSHIIGPAEAKAKDQTRKMMDIHPAGCDDDAGCRSVELELKRYLRCCVIYLVIYLVFSTNHPAMPRKKVSPATQAETVVASAPLKPTRPLVFISHDHRDGELAAAFATLLTDASGGSLKLFRSSDPKGEHWHRVRNRMAFRDYGQCCNSDAQQRLFGL